MVVIPGAHAAPNGLLKAMNEARAAHGLAPLRANATLKRAARAHSSDMLRRDVFGHYGFTQRMIRHRVRGPFVGENLAWGTGARAGAAAVVAGWLASPSHRANLLNPRFRLVGLGFARGTFIGRPGATVVTANFAGA